uniref:WAS/WASL interacting protein family member 2 n=1 Tax=Vombatus ursinus TaxID=29139 RepID=A0A4X2L5M7_VOMUR
MSPNLSYFYKFSVLNVSFWVIAAPPPPPPLIRNGARDAPPPPPPYRIHGCTEPLSRGKPPPPPSRTPAGPPPPPPPPLRNGHRDSIATVRSFLDDFESKYSFHPVEDFPAPEEYKHFQRIYPSKTNRGEESIFIICTEYRSLVKWTLFLTSHFRTDYKISSI